MSVVKRYNRLIGLRDLEVLVHDLAMPPDNNLDKYFNVLECPELLTQGKSSFLIGGSQYLKSGVELKIEIVNDQTQEVIYTEPVRGHLEAGSRRVSIEVYSDVTPGPHTLYVVGELNPATSDVTVTPEWQNIYNVRWSKQLTVSGTGVNTEPIYFYKQPSISVSEIFRGYLDTPTQLTSSVYLTGSGTPREGLPPLVPVENTTVGGQVTSATYPALDFANKAGLTIIENNRPITKLSGKHGHIGSMGIVQNLNSPAPDDYLIGIDKTTTAVNSLYIGNPFTVNYPRVNTSQFVTQSYHSIPSVYSSSIMKVIKDDVFVPKDVFYIYDNRTSPATLVPAPLASQYISASYQDLVTQTPSTINYFSYADIQLTNLETFSGDVHRVKIYAKSEGSIGDFEKIYDSPIESSEILFDDTDQTLLANMGYWVDQTRLNKYWQSYEGNNGNESSGTLTYNASYIMDAMKISGSNMGLDEELRVELKQTGSFLAGNAYTFSSKLYGKKSKKILDASSGDSSNKGELFIYVSGSAFNPVEPASSHWGVKKLEVGTDTTTDFPTGVSEYYFGKVEGQFIADNTGNGKIQFKVPSGEWYMSDISVKAASDTAFHPDYVRVVAPVPPLYTRPDNVRFLVEFYDVNNNIADTTIFSDFFSFQGENVAIGGTDNILSGSLTMGNALYEGIEMAGLSSAYVRSIGYNGFTNAADGTQSGFVMWSGSILPSSGDNYAGVGMELVGHSGSYLRFRTEPSELDIRADAFFVGNPNSQFVSGSGGNVEISSSNFHLSPTGDVTMQGTITADAGDIGDWKIIDGKLSGSNATLDAVGAALYHTTKGPGSDSPAGGFHQLRDEYYIDFTPDEALLLRQENIMLNLDLTFL